MKFLESQPLSAIALILGVVALLFSFSNFSAKKELKEKIASLEDKIQENYDDLDKKLESQEHSIVKLKEEGFIEIDGFTDFSKKITSAMVIIANQDEVDSSFSLEDIGSEKTIGSGFFVAQGGYIATARHVIDGIGINKIIVINSSGQIFKPQEIRIADNADVAIVKIGIEDNPYIGLGYSDNLSVGEEIGLAGFNIGFSQPLVHRGIISSKGTSKDGTQVFTFNAFVNKGNSGGPVFSSVTGRIVGVLSARQRDLPTDSFITIPEGYSSGITLGSVDPLKFSVDLYNKTLEVVGDVSQVGIGIATSADVIRQLMRGN